jgi:hypothetical protein
MTPNIDRAPHSTTSNISTKMRTIELKLCIYALVEILIAIVVFFFV